MLANHVEMGRSLANIHPKKKTKSSMGQHFHGMQPGQKSVCKFLTFLELGTFNTILGPPRHCI